MPSLSLKDLLEAGAHFGHQTRRWNPKMKKYILCARNGIYIVDLNKTLQNLDSFIARVVTEVQKGGKVLFVGTKRQFKDCIREEAVRCKMPFVTERWLGGMLTNFQTIRLSIRKLDKIEQMEKDGTIEALPKKEVLQLAKKKEKLMSILGGVRDLRKLPAVIFVVDSLKEHIAISEARRLGIPIGAIVDTNSDPEGIDYPIPGNDDAIKSVFTITRAITDALLAIGNNVPVKDADVLDDQGKVIPAALIASIEEDDSDDAVAVAAPAAAPVADTHRVVRKKMVKSEE